MGAMAWLASFCLAEVYLADDWAAGGRRRGLADARQGLRQADFIVWAYIGRILAKREASSWLFIVW